MGGFMFLVNSKTISIEAVSRFSRLKPFQHHLPHRLVTFNVRMRSL